jgi:predicted RNA-binding Zn-ribbon protein involved in translation (DUF1610 family)
MTEIEEVIEDAEVEEVRQLPAVRASEAVIARGELSVDEVVEQKDKIVQVMNRVMREGMHYGKIPGVPKPTLLKPGAEAINVALRLAPHYDSEKIWHDDGHLTVVAKCELQHIPTGLVVGTGEGLCTSRETRYAYRNAQRVCPNCGEPQIKRSKFKPKGGDYEGASEDDEPGWYCWKKEGGCGWNFAADDARIVDQQTGKVDNPEIADTYNTVLKMADKRALVAAVLNATAASDVFTQDVEDQSAAAADVEGEGTMTDADIEKQAEPKPFDPAKDLLPNAIKGSAKKDVEKLQETLLKLNDHVDWKATIGAATLDHFGKERTKLAKAERDEWWVRLRNATAKLEEISHPDLGASPKYVQHAFGFAFELEEEKVTIVVVTPPEEPEEEPAPNVEFSEEAVQQDLENIPFGE